MKDSGIPLDAKRDLNYGVLVETLGRIEDSLACIDEKLDDVKTEVRGGEDQESRDKSLRGRVISIEDTLEEHGERIGDLENKYDGSPHDVSDKARREARIATISVVGIFVGGVTLGIARGLGWIPT